MDDFTVDMRAVLALTMALEEKGYDLPRLEMYRDGSGCFTAFPTRVALIEFTSVDELQAILYDPTDALAGVPKCPYRRSYVRMSQVVGD